MRLDWIGLDKSELDGCGDYAQFIGYEKNVESPNFRQLKLENIEAKGNKYKI